MNVFKGLAVVGVECNYDDNYYGDQVCVLKQS